MNVVDSSGWLEYFSDGKSASRFASALIMPIVSIYEVFKVLLREAGEDVALQAAFAMLRGHVVELTPKPERFSPRRPDTQKTSFLRREQSIRSRMDGSHFGKRKHSIRQAFRLHRLISRHFAICATRSRALAYANTPSPLSRFRRHGLTPA